MEKAKQLSAALAQEGVGDSVLLFIAVEVVTRQWAETRMGRRRRRSGGGRQQARRWGCWGAGDDVRRKKSGLRLKREKGRRSEGIIVSLLFFL